MSNEKSRQEFEAWFLSNYSWFIDNKKGGYSLDRRSEEPFQYVASIPHHDFRIWLASRESLVIELPAIEMAQRSDEEATFSAGGNNMRRKVIKALEASGLKVKS